jgi:hypothetical protein
MSKASKLTKILSGIKHAQEILDLLDSVVDVDRLIGISNAQGPLAKVIKSVLSEKMDELEHETQSSSPSKGRKKLPSKKGGG